jgi:membrane protease YdiL (CAAX protease family)
MLSEKPWKPDAVMLLVAGLMLSLCVGLSAQYLLERLRPELPVGTKQFYTFVTNVVGFHVVALVLVTVFLRHHRTGWLDFLGLRTRGLLRHLALALAVAVVVVPLALTLNRLCAELIELLHMTAEPQPVIKVLKVSETPAERICFFLAAIAFAPVVEECLFRGILYPVVKQHGHPRAALFGTSLLFASIHANLMTFVPLTLFAVVMVLLYEKTDTLLAPILAHALFNLSNFLLFLYEEPVQRWLERLA